MPAALIEVRRQYSADEEIAIIDAVHNALVEAFRIPPEDRNI
ncbi:MAG: tautomerase family protein, partial [Actinobacteria bacterium]|nr:tautomerase family protein [Actinomycetota bacterium]